MRYETCVLQRHAYEKLTHCIIDKQDNRIIAECEKDGDAKVVVISLNLAEKVIDKLTE